MWRKEKHKSPDAATVEGRRREWIQTLFFFYTVVQKKSEYLCLYSCPLRSYTQHSGEDHANSSTLYKNMSSFFI